MVISQQNTCLTGKQKFVGHAGMPFANFNLFSDIDRIEPFKLTGTLPVGLFTLK